MKEMSQQVQRWQNPIRTVRVPERWNDWALALLKRHGRIPYRHAAVAMTLMQPIARLYLVCQRWQSHAWKLFPQINLVLAPMLQQSVWQALSALQRGLIQDRLQEAGIRQELRGKQKAFLHYQAGNSSRSAHGWQEPLQQVFSRMNEIAQVPRQHVQSRSAEESRQILRRVVHERQRMEERRQNATMVNHQSQPQPDRSAAANERALMESQRDTRVNSRQWPQTNSASPPNIDQLTEQVVRQIDRRLVAWRERTGRVF